MSHDHSSLRFRWFGVEDERPGGGAVQRLELFPRRADGCLGLPGACSAAKIEFLAANYTYFSSAHSSSAMFSRFARLPLRRCLHTASTASKSAPRFSRNAKVVLGTSAAAAAYLSWNLASQRNTVYMDSPAKSHGAWIS